MISGPAALMGALQNLFTGLYGQRFDRTAFIAYEPMGLPISPDMFRLPGTAEFSQALALERLSEIADVVPTFDGDLIHRTARHLDAVIESIVDAATPATAAAAAPVGAAKAAAREALDAVLGSLAGPQSFHPANPAPADWYDPSNSANWTRATLADPGAAAADQNVPPALWRVVPDDIRPQLEQPLAAAYPALSRIIGRWNLPPAAGLVGNLIGGLLGGQSELGQALSPALVALSIASLDAQARKQQVEASALDVTLEYCAVTLDRPWWPDRLLLAGDWALPGYRQGAFSQGTGASDPGLLPAVTTGFVAVRNLAITGSWSQADRALVTEASSLGPFALQGRTFDPGRSCLTAPGMQIVAWFCDALPVIPPVSAVPALRPA